MASVVEILRELWHDLLDFLFPPTCLLCGRPSDDALCEVCAASLEVLDAGFCPVCEAPISADQRRCPEDHGKRQCPVDFVRPLAPFDQKHRRLIHMLKYYGASDVARLFGRRLGELILREQHFQGFEGLVPVPLHEKRLRERRYNQAELLAQAASEVCGLPVLPVAKRIKNTQSQTKLSARQRRENVRGAFRIDDVGAVSGRMLVVVDDVVTTGATTGELARALLEAGAKSVCAICIAHPPLHESRAFGI